MAGFLGMFNYNKEGPGVKKEEKEEKHRIILFFEIYFTKFGKIVLSNLVFTLFCLPFLAAFFIVSILLNNAFLPLVFFIGFGPAIAGITFVIRNIVRERQVFVWSDFVANYKSNWKQSTIVTAFDVLVVMLLSIAIPFYYNHSSTQSVYYIPLLFCIFAGIIVLFLNYYLFIFIVTFDQKLLLNIKNAAIFAVAGLFRNIITTIIVGILTYIVIRIPELFVFLLPIFIVSLGFYIMIFNTWPIIDLYMVKPIEDSQEIKDDEGHIFEDQG